MSEPTAPTVGSAKGQGLNLDHDRALEIRRNFLRRTDDLPCSCKVLMLEAEAHAITPFHKAQTALGLLGKRSQARDVSLCPYNTELRILPSIATLWCAEDAIEPTGLKHIEQLIRHDAAMNLD